MTTITRDLRVADLAVSPRNVRKAGPGDLTDLAASIASLGLIHPLKVVTRTGGKQGQPTHDIIAGSRRFAAVKALIKQKRLPKTFRLRCEIVDEASAEEISLAENVVRLNMHPADQFDAFRALADQGEGLAAIAGKFGVPDSLVRKRLRLAHVAPVILDAFRQDELSVEQVMAYAVTEDAVRQLTVFQAMGPDAAEWRIRNALTEGHVPATDKRVRFVTLDAYHAAGGASYADLFARDSHDHYLMDSALLDRLVTEKLEETRQAVAAEGWLWCTIETGPIDHAAYSGRLYPQPKALAAEDQARRDALTLQCEDLGETIGEDDSPEALAAYDALCAELDALEEKAQAFDPLAMRHAGAILGLTADGNVHVTRGLIRTGDQPKTTPGAATRDPFTLGDALTRDLSHVRSSIIAAALSGDPRLGLVGVAHALALPLFYPGAGTNSALNLRLLATRLPEATPGSGVTRLQTGLEEWRTRLPACPADLWAWCNAAECETLHGLLAICAAAALDATLDGKTRPGPRHEAADRLADALAVDPSAWVSLEALDIFARAPKAYTLAVVREEIGPGRADSYAGMKKAEMASRTTAALSGKWLPGPVLRTAPGGAPVA